MGDPRSADVLLLGGGVASVRCARTLRRRGFDGSIVLVGDEPHAPYNRPPLSKELLRDDVPDDLVAAEPAGWYERHAVELRTGVPVVALDVQERVAELGDGSRLRYAQCLLATGAGPRLPLVPGAEHAQLLRTLDDARHIRSRAVSAVGGAAVVIGGGFIGVEAGASLAAASMRVTIVELAAALWGGTLGEALSQWAMARLADAGVSVRTSTGAGRVEPDAVWIGSERLEADLVLAGVGVTPRESLARAAGLAVDDGILTDATHLTSAPGVYAAGDVARVDGVRVEHWHAAREGGERAALAMLGEPPGPARAPWVFSEFAGQQLDVVGLAPRWDEERVLGDPTGHRFAVAFVEQGRVAQLAIVNAAIPVEEARAMVERGATAAELAATVGRGLGD